MYPAAQLRHQAKTFFTGKLEPLVGTHEDEVTCATCRQRERCLAGCVSDEDLGRVENVVYTRRRTKRGAPLLVAGDRFEYLYAIRSGSFKTCLVEHEGREQVTGFFMGGDILGMEGLGHGRYQTNAVGLEDGDVCAMPYSLIELLGRELPSLQRGLEAALAREIQRSQSVMMILGSMGARERLAAFLVNLSRRYLRGGLSSSELHLRMTREEIGSYLGLKLETVSRLFSGFQRDGLMEVHLKHVRILDMPGLQRALGQG